MFRDPPVFKGPAKALILTGFHISPILPEGFSRRSNRTSTPLPEPSEPPMVSVEPPGISETTPNLPHLVRLAVSTLLVSRLTNPNAPKVKSNLGVNSTLRSMWKVYVQYHLITF